MKKIIYVNLFVMFVLSVALFSQGSLVIIGGALNPENHAIYNKFIQLGGGKEKIRLAIIPAASGNPSKTAQSCADDFTRHGIPKSNIKIFPLAVKDDPSTKTIDESQWSQNGKNKELTEEMLTYTAVFFVGGDQARYRQTLMDNKGYDLPLLTAIRAIYHNGGVIGGTSAGAAVMSDPMIISGNPRETITAGVIYQTTPSPTPDSPKKTKLTKGFGFFEHGLIDQHFLKRGRAGRLIPSTLYSKKQKKHTMGFGVDEDTALVYNNNTVEIIGSSGILIIDTSKAEIKETKWGPKIKNIILHYLAAGDSLNLETGKFQVNPKRKKIKKGNEYYKKYPLDTNIFGKDALKELLTAGLVDNRQQKSEGLCFTLNPNGSGTGIHCIFRKTTNTLGYYGKINGKETFSALHVSMDFFPISIQVEKKG